MSHPKPVVLCILDGWGLSPDTTANAPHLAHTPAFDAAWATCPHATLITHGPDAGLPRGQMGNSEVGHTNIGAGRVVAMDLGQIDLAIEDGSFRTNPAVLGFAARLKASGGTAHLIGLASHGGVHAHIAHLIEATHLLVGLGVPVAIHAITDGRDVPPLSCLTDIGALERALPQGARIATVCGRYWAMDRDNRWDRVSKAWKAMVLAQADERGGAESGIATCLDLGQTDEFIEPFVVQGYTGMRDGDGIFCLNFRADRARELMSAIGDPAFCAFDITGRPSFAALLGLVDYSAAHSAYMTAAYPKQTLVNTLGEWVAGHGKRQFRLAETEKYPHVTFFLNGGKETPEPGEDRAMPKSPKVATYDLQPEMSCDEVTENFLSAIAAGYDLIVVNYANPDMVGHTGSLPAAIAACAAVDRGLARVIPAIMAAGGAMVLTADHGNCETMVDPVTGAPHTAHTLNPVPVILIGGPPGARLRDGRLADVAPTLLALMGLPQPPEMTGQSLILA